MFRGKQSEAEVSTALSVDKPPHLAEIQGEGETPAWYFTGTREDKMRGICKRLINLINKVGDFISDQTPDAIRNRFSLF